MQKMDSQSIERRVEEFIRSNFSISPTDPVFEREADLFEGGYVDSVGVVELLEFLSTEFGVEIPDDDLLTDEFASVGGIARIVSRNLGPQTGPLAPAQEAPFAGEL
jgi:acyl carrier protein